MMGEDRPPRPVQLSLELREDLAAAPLDDQLRSAVTAALKGPMSRDHVADALTLVLGFRVTRNHIERWVAPSKPTYRIPAVAIPKLCRLLGNARPLEVLAEAAGLHVIAREDFERLELARREDERARLAREIGRRRRLLEASEASKK